MSRAVTTAMLVLAMPLAITMATLSGAKTPALERCDAVEAMAQLKVHPSLPFSVARDYKKKWCSFFVYLPPARVESEPVSNAAQLYQEIYRLEGDPETKFKAMKEADLFGKIVEALVLPLLDESFEGNDRAPFVVNFLRTKARSTIENCVELSITKHISFEKFPEAISCGLIDTSEGKSFAILAALDDLSIRLTIPAIQG